MRVLTLSVVTQSKPRKNCSMITETIVTKLSTKFTFKSVDFTTFQIINIIVTFAK